MIQNLTAPVITIDGGSGCGTSSLRFEIATILNYRPLDSGAWYRALALECRLFSHLRDTDAIDIARGLRVQTLGKRYFIDNKDRTDELRSAQVGLEASKIARIPGVRNVLNDKFREMRQLPGLVADGRDMAYVFDEPNVYRFFIKTPLEIRAKRLHKEFASKNNYVSEGTILKQITERDLNDFENPAHPFQAHPDCELIDNTGNSPREIARQIIDKCGL